MLVQSRTTEYRSGGVRHPTLQCAHPTRHVWGTRQSRRLRTADGFAANPQMTTRHFPPPWTVEDIGAAFFVKDNAPSMKAISRPNTM